MSGGDSAITVADCEGRVPASSWWPRRWPKRVTRNDESSDRSAGPSRRRAHGQRLAPEVRNEVPTAGLPARRSASFGLRVGERVPGAACGQTLGSRCARCAFPLEEPQRLAAGETAMNRPPLPGRSLPAIPKLSDLAERPELVSALPPDAAGALLVKIAPLQTALLARVLVGVGNPDRADRCISVQAAASRLGVSRGWIYKHKATLPFMRCVGNTIRCSEAGITAWLDGRRLSGHL